MRASRYSNSHSAPAWSRRSRESERRSRERPTPPLWKRSPKLPVRTAARARAKRTPPARQLDYGLRQTSQLLSILPRPPRVHARRTAVARVGHHSAEAYRRAVRSCDVTEQGASRRRVETLQVRHRDRALDARVDQRRAESF